MKNTTETKIYLVAKVSGELGDCRTQYILKTTNKAEAEATAKWHGATIVEV